MLRSWRLGSLFGIGIYVHWSFLLIVGYVFYTNWNMGGLDQARYGVTLLLAVFGCVVLHELGHALTARLYKIPTRDITLYPIGGVARLERMSDRPLEEFWIALAGPAVNLVIFLFLLPLVVIASGPAAFGLGAEGGISSRFFLRDLALVNLGLILFNLLPAFPMDGGRVLRAILTLPLGRLPATQIAAALGTVFALLFAIVGTWFLGNPMMILVAAFVFFAGQQELAMVRQRERRRRGEPIDVLPAEEHDIIDLPPAEPDPLFSGTTWDATTRAWVVWREGRPIHTYWVD